jgi:FkbM family methyltransferase
MHLLSLKGMNYDRGHFVHNSGERWVMKYLNKRFNRSDPVFFDVGANKGQYASVLLQTFKGNCALHSFEPGQKAFEKLMTLKDNRLHSHNVGLSDKIGEAELFTGNDDTVWASLYEVKHIYGHHNTHLTHKEKIQLSFVDLFCREKKISRINFMKLDVEGHELAVLKGAVEMLKNDSIDLIQFEFGFPAMPARILLKDFFELLTKYKIYRILQDGIREVKYSEHLEIFATTNYLAVNNKFNL